MILFNYLILVVVNFIINSQCVLISQSINPEYNAELDGGDMVPHPLSTSSTGRGVAISPASNNKWPRGEVPYVFASNISSNNSLFIERMMREMENLTKVNDIDCIKFRPKNASDLYYITIFNGSGCYAPVGSWGNYNGVRPVSLMDSPTTTCMVTGIIQHELTHVLGFYHEQSRPDRDSYVSIQWSNIDPANVFNFNKYNNSQVDTQGTPYDYGSVMHYDRYAFAINRSVATIIPTQNASAYIGQRIQLSPIDILEIQRYYGCVPTPTTTVTTTTTSGATTQTTTTVTRITASGATTQTTTTVTTITASGATTQTTTTVTTITASGATTQTTTTTISTSTISRTTTSSTTSTIITTISNRTNSPPRNKSVRNTFQSYFEIHFIFFILIIYFMSKI